MGRPIAPESRGRAYWSRILAELTRLRTAVMLDESCEEVLTSDTIVHTDRFIELCRRHLARFPVAPIKRR